ncbi:MAG: C-terminal target protein [Ferruginibacter sp.]|nr:C-terminal target protein [Ferruginibacter sp.]
MKEIYHCLLRASGCSKPIILQTHLKILLCVVVFFRIPLGAISQTNNYFGVSGALNGNVWSTNPAGPYTSPLNTSGGAIINFDNDATITGSTTNVVAINASANVTWVNGGTLSTGGTVAPFTIASGKVVNMSQAISSVPGTGFNKLGAGVLLMSTISIYTGGFTLNGGTIVIGGINAMGGNILSLNGGIVAANNNRDLGGKYPGGILIGGDVQFGDINLPAVGSANITFTDFLSLGGMNRVFTLGGSGIISLGGVISNSGGNGISFTSNAGGSGLFDITNTANTFTGPVNLNGGQTRFTADGSFGNASNIIQVDGGQLLNSGSFTIGNTHLLKLGNTTGSAINVVAGTLTIDALISDKTSSGMLTKVGAGTLLLTNANTYSGTTTIGPNGGVLQLARVGGNTLSANNNIVVNGGSLKISSNQTVNDLSLVNGNLTIDDGTVLTINGTLDYFQPSSITLTGTGKILYGPLGALKYSGSIAKIITAAEFPATGGPFAVAINNSGGVTIPTSLGGRTVAGNLQLSNGVFTIGPGTFLDLNGASLIAGSGYIAGSNSSDFFIHGNTGGTVNLPTNSNLLLRNITIAGNRTLAMNGIDNIALSGLLTISSGAGYDSGGESQVTQNGGGNIIISGRFITRDMQGFSGINTSIPGILPTLNAGCTIEYGLASGNSQAVTSRNDYRNLVFSGSGVKIVTGPFNPAGTIYITGAAILDAGSHTLGDINTSLTMDGGRFKLSGTNNPQPHMSGTYNLKGGIIEFACNGISGQTIRNTAYQNIEITGAYVGNSNGNITLNNNGSFTVKSGGSFEINDNSITAAASTGGQIVTVENNASFLCGNNQGFNGYSPSLSNNSSVHANITNISLVKGNPGSSVNYTRLGDQPLTTANGLVYSNLILSGSGIKTAPTGELSINGNLTKTTACKFEHNNGTVQFNSTTSSQSISASALPNLVFYDLHNENTSSGGLNINNDIAVSNELALANNSILDLNAGDIRLLSSVNNTSRVAPVPASAFINYQGTGRFIVERYYPALRAWRLITSPLSSESTPTTIFSEWQNNGVFAPGLGSFVTGPGANLSGNGLDNSSFNNYSLKSFQNNTYVNIGNTLTPLSKGSLSAANIGYFMFVRGDRSRAPDNTVFPNTNTTTLSSRGKLQTGNQIFSGLARTVNGARLFSLVGNPYASAIDFNKISRTNVMKRFIVWDPKLNTVGGFVTVDDFDNDGIYSITPPSLGGQDLNIQSSQAFFFETDAMGDCNVTFNESSKSTANNLGIFRPVSTTPFFRSYLYLLDDDQSTRLADGNLAEFGDSFHDTVDLQDALKFGNVNETFGLFRTGSAMAIERRPLITTMDTLFYTLTRTTPRAYELLFEPGNLNPLLSAYLNDNYTRMKIPLNVNSSGRYKFIVNSDAGSTAPDRFSVIFKSERAVTLAVIFNSIKAMRKDNSIFVQWTLQNESNIVQYEVWKSDDGINFNKVATINSNSLNGADHIYSWLDLHPGSAANFYRICSIDAAGKTDCSRVVSQSFDALPAISVFPNPVRGRTINLQFNNSPTGFYFFRLINSSGQIVFSKMIFHAMPDVTEAITPGTPLPSGMYQLEISLPTKTTSILQMIIQ